MRAKDIIQRLAVVRLRDQSALGRGVGRRSENPDCIAYVWEISYDAGASLQIMTHSNDTEAWMSSSAPPTARGSGGQRARSAHWGIHVAIVLAAALVAVIFPSLITRFSRPIGLVLWALAFVSAATAMITSRRLAREMTAGYAFAFAGAAMMFWNALGNAPAQEVVIKSIGALFFLISLLLLVDAIRRMRQSARLAQK